MFHLWNRLHSAREPGAPSLAQVITACAAYSAVLIFALLVFGVSPSTPHPVVPPAIHQHNLHPNQVPSETGLVPNQRLCTSRLATPRPCGHQHTNHGHVGGHDGHKRLSPRELSLAKW